MLALTRKPVNGHGTPRRGRAKPARGRPKETLRGKKILVTGGAGLIGSHIVDLVVEAGCKEVVVIDNMVRGRKENLGQSMPSGKVRLVVGDIRNTHVLADLVRGTHFVFHQAELTPAQCSTDPRAAIEVMVNGTFELLDMCREAGVRKIVMASSASVYGMAQAFPTSEQHHPYGNRTIHGAAKTFGEGLLRAYHDLHGTRYVCLRYFNVYGPRMDLRSRSADEIIRWMERIEKGLAPIIYGNGRQTVDLLHVRDAARANILSALSPASDVALNIASGAEVSVYGLTRNLAQAMGKPGIEPALWEARTTDPVVRRMADVNAARRVIGFETAIGLEEGLADLVQWWRRRKLGTRAPRGRR